MTQSEWMDGWMDGWMRLTGSRSVRNREIRSVASGTESGRIGGDSTFDLFINAATVARSHPGR